MDKIYYIPKLGGFYKIVKSGDKFYIKKAPAIDGYITNFDCMEFTLIGYMGNDPNSFETMEQAEAFLQGMKFHANL